MEKALQALREMAIFEVMYKNDDLKKAVMEYETVSVYNKINGKNTTIENAEKEAILKSKLVKLLEKYEIQISNEMQEIIKKAA